MIIKYGQEHMGRTEQVTWTGIRVCKHMRQEKIENHTEAARSPAWPGHQSQGRQCQRQIWDQTEHGCRQGVGTLKAKGTLGPGLRTWKAEQGSSLYKS